MFLLKFLTQQKKTLGKGGPNEKERHGGKKERR